MGWWFRDRRGRIILAQLPNTALWVWIAATILGWSGYHRVQATGVAHGALIVWAADELVRGVNPFRRALGATVLIAQLAVLL